MESEQFAQLVLLQFPDVLGFSSVAPGMIILHHVDGSFDIYFDPDRWELSDPDRWYDLETEPIDLQGTGLRVIETANHCQPDTTHVIAFAMGVLQARCGDHFYRHPLAPTPPVSP